MQLSKVDGYLSKGYIDVYFKRYKNAEKNYLNAHIVGNSQTPNRDKNWRELIQFTKSKRSFKDLRSKDDKFMPEKQMSPKPTKAKLQISPITSVKNLPQKRD